MNHAVLVGINSYKQVSGLLGCINDVEDVAKALSSAGVVPEANVVKLIDDRATKSAIVTAVKEMLGKLKFGERGYLHLSGHGVRLPSSDPEEGDALDEVFCAYDFDWTAKTSVVDEELYQLLTDRAPGSVVLVTLDCCHSGDQARTLVRTLLPPPEIRSKIDSRKRIRRGFRDISRSTGVAFLSACSPWEEAADTSFDNRPNGAFTYYFLAEHRTKPGSTFQEVALALRTPLGNYNMNPVAEGDVNFAWLDGGRRRLRLATASTRSVSLVRGSEVVFERTFSNSFAGQPVSAHVRITADNGQLLLFASLAMLGANVAIPPMTVSGDRQVEVPLVVLGARLVVSISGWRLESGAVRFDLGLSLVTSMWFVPAVTLGQVPVSLAVTQLTRSGIPAVATPADLVALLALSAQRAAPSQAGGNPIHSTSSTSPVRAYRDPRLQVFASDVAEWGPNWREDRLIRPFANTPRPEGIQRAHVEIGPQRGSGNVYVVGWASAQETDFDFILHMGNDFFGGWGDINWRVVGFYYNESPFPRTPAGAPAYSTNGKSRLPADEFPMPMPEGGGSIRA